MEGTVLSIGKSVLSGAVNYAKSSLAKEVALQLGIETDHDFITNELAVMHAFLMAAHDETDDNFVVKVWAQQVSNLAYDVEDTLQDFAVRLNSKSWWSNFRVLLDRHNVATRMKELRASVEDVSQRNMRYNVISHSGRKDTVVAEQSRIPSAAPLAIDVVGRRAAKLDKSKVDLFQLINGKGSDLRVIAVCGATVNGQTPIIRAVYENADIKREFSCRVWVRMMYPFDPVDFIQNMVHQFHNGVGAGALFGKEKSLQELIASFDEYLIKRRYLVVINDVRTIEEWDQVRSCFPDNNMGSRIIVSAPAVQVASLCAGPASELSELSADTSIYAFHQKVELYTPHVSRCETSNCSCSVGQKPTTMDGASNSNLVGREKEKDEIIKLISNQDSNGFQVISVWGAGGLGKTTIVKHIFEDQLRTGMFERRAWVTVMRPFALRELIGNLVIQLGGNVIYQAMMGPLHILKDELIRILKRHSCLIVIDDISCTAEWDMILPNLVEMENRGRIIVTTRASNIAVHCSARKENVYALKKLEYREAYDLFTKQVFKESTDLEVNYPQLLEQGELIIRNCDRLPLAIVTIGGFLANRPKKVSEWRSLSNHLSTVLTDNPELGAIRTALISSYEGLPYHLKPCFLYMPLFPEDYRVGRGRLVRRWTAEGYPSEVQGQSLEEIADAYFLELVSRGIILPCQASVHSRKGIDSWQIHDLMRDIGLSNSMEENLTFTLEEGCSSNRVRVRHLAINGNWRGDKKEFESTIEMQCLRSVTVFGIFKPFFISEKMKVLRVLDLEDTLDLRNHHLKKIGKFLHLRYFSLKGCSKISRLPDSLGDLRELLTLDVRGTSIRILPKSIINLEKLNNLRAGTRAEEPFGHFGTTFGGESDGMLEERHDCMEYTFGGPITHGAIPSVQRCIDAWRNPYISLTDDFITRCCFDIPAARMRLDTYGVVLPRGVSKMKALHRLTSVNIGQDRTYVLHEVKELSRLRKLGVTGVNKENGKELCVAVTALSRLESLSIQAEKEKEGLCDCLDGGSFSFPENLHTLKLYGELVKLPEWIKGLTNLVKLKLKSFILDHSHAMEILGDMPNLTYLELMGFDYNDGSDADDVDRMVMERNLREDAGGFHIVFNPLAFRKLLVLELHYSAPKSIKFCVFSAPSLELVKFTCMRVNSQSVSGISHLKSLKEVLIESGFASKETFEFLQTELAHHPNRPVVKLHTMQVENMAYYESTYLSATGV